VTAVSTVALLFWVALVASALCVAEDERLREMLTDHWKGLAILLVLTLLWRIPANGIFFHGLEYEDSYVYTVAGRQMADHAGPPSISSDSPYSINACAVGSITACQQWERFPEHLIGYPYVISIISSALGYIPSMGSFINLLASSITSLFVFFIGLLISNDLNVASLAGVTFAVTPVFAVYGLETSAEPFSNVCVTLVVWLYLRLCDSNQLGGRRQVVTWIAYSATLLFSQTVKRENVLLAAIMLAMLPLMLHAENSKRLEKYTLGGLVTLTSVLAVILSVKMRLLQTSSSEAELLRQFPMTLRHLATFVVGFLRSFLVVEWYGGTVFAVVAGATVACSRRGRVLLPLVLLAAYILLYASHVRSYYEMKSGRIEPEAALRFSMNFMGLWAIAAGLGIGSILTRVGRSPLWNSNQTLSTLCAGTVATVLLVASFVTTVHLRDHEVEDETISRLTPALCAVHFASHIEAQFTYVATMEPLVIQMYAEPTTRIVGLESVNSDTLRALLSPSEDSHLIFLEETDRLSNDDLSRYEGPVRYLLSRPSEVLHITDRFRVLSVDSFDSR